MVSSTSTICWSRTRSAASSGPCGRRSTTSSGASGRRSCGSTRGSLTRTARPRIRRTRVVSSLALRVVPGTTGGGWKATRIVAIQQRRRRWRKARCGRRRSRRCRLGGVSRICLILVLTRRRPNTRPGARQSKLAESSRRRKRSSAMLRSWRQCSSEQPHLPICCCHGGGGADSGRQRDSARA